MTKIRWGVIGAGGIARRRTIPEGLAVARNAELVVVYSPSSGADVARHFGVQCAAVEEEVYDADIDAVYVASPVDCHCRQVERAAAAGRHVLCEKPLALNLAEANRMVAACTDAQVTLGVGFMMRGHAHHRQAADLIRRGALGAVVYARAQLSCWYPPLPSAWRQDPARSGGGVLPDLASHCFDLLEFILGAHIDIVFCRRAQLVHAYPVEDTAVTLVTFANGATATVDCLFNVPDESVKNRLEIYGSRGSLLAEGTLGQVQGGTLRWLPGRVADYDASQGRPAGDGEQEFSLPTGNLYRALIEDFGDAICEGRAPLATGRQGLRLQRILAACTRSAAEGRAIAVEDVVAGPS